MKFFIYVFLLIVGFSYQSFAQNKTNGKPVNELLITGTVKGFKDSTQISIIDPDANFAELTKSKIMKGKFTLRTSVKEQKLYFVRIDGFKELFPIFAGNEKLRLTGNSSNYESFNFSGSANQDFFINYLKKTKPYFDACNQLNVKMRNGIVTDSIKNAYKANAQSLINEVDKITMFSSESPVVPLMFIAVHQYASSFFPNFLQERFEKMNDKTKETFYGNIIKANLTKPIEPNAIGSKAIDFTQADTEGKMVSLSSFRGKYVLIDFWSSWCRPCRIENPNVVANYNKFKNKNFTVLGISLDSDRNAWLNAIKQDNLTWTNLSDLNSWQNAVAQLYSITSIPQNVLIDPNGVIIDKNLRGSSLQAKLCEVLGCD